MVGGYSDALFLQNFIIETFTTKTVIIPNEPGTAVLQGAVMFGHDPSIIAERRCRFTYGIKTIVIHNEKLHKASKRFSDEDGVTRAKDIFDVHVKIGQNVKSGAFQHSVQYIPLRKDQKALMFQLYASPRSDPQYTDEDDCTEINSRSIDISDLKGTISDKAVDVSLSFSGPLITLKAVKQQSGEEITHRVSYNWSTDDHVDYAAGAGLTKQNLEVSVFCAMEFGASTCSCSLAFQHDPSNVLTIPLSPDIKNRYRQLTCILFDKEQNYNSFGFEAEEKYSTIKNQKDWFFFKDYKKALYVKSVLNRKTTINDTLGRKFALFKVIRETLKYLKTEMSEYFNSRSSYTLNQFESRYILTVPETWTDSVRRFVEDATQEAGIPREQLILCNEAEAITLYCQSIPCQTLAGTLRVESNSLSFDRRRRYVVVIGGNQRVYFTAINVDSAGHVEDSQDMGSCEWGISVACESFSKFLHDAFGDKAMTEAKTSEKEELYELMNDFKWKSHSLSLKSEINRKETFKIPLALRMSARQTAFKFDNVVTFVGNKMRISHKKMLDFHTKSLKQIANHLSTRLSRGSFIDVSTIILVEEYSECLVLQEYIADKFPSKTIVVPEMPSEAVLRGAIRFGCGK